MEPANLAPAFLDQIIRKYEGTRLGRQELEAELLDDVPGDTGPAISSKRRERIMRPR
jgi:phage terminase large subunit-like protein